MHLVPRPESVQPASGSFELSDPVRIVYAAPDDRIAEIADLLATAIRARTGFEVRVSSAEKADGAIVLDAGLEHSNPEAYVLQVSPRGVRVQGAAPEGLLWGVQTFRQLLPPAFEDVDGARRDSWSVPAIRIEDAPRFPWRGSLMDVSRHFFPVDFVKRYIDLLSRYKMNVLHWHLTEDQGWRLEIQAYPRLTEVAAWRTEPDGSRHGGFYTQAEVREVVEHARVRGVRVVPEIEMPGHSSAALVAYPELACADPPDSVPNQWGVFRDIYCAGKEETFVFLERVLDEVASLFPSPYVHIGGDEVPKDRWEECAACQELMQREGLADESALQAWFLRRIGEVLADRGKTMIGWDEILDGGGVPGSVVQVWRDPATIREAVRAGHDVIASPTSHAYFDYSPAGLPMEQVYSFEPLPSGLTPAEQARVLGGEANLWSEYITTANFDLMAFPRLLAISEVLWSRGERDFDDFESRLDADHYPRLRAMGVRPGPEDSDIVRLRVGTDSRSGEPRVHVDTPVEGLDVRFTTDGSTPTESSRRLSDTTSFVAGETVTLGVFVDGEPIPIRRQFSVVDHLARGKEVRVEAPPSVRYPGPGTGALTDGLRGSDNHHDGVWQGWWEDDLTATVDLGSVVEIHSVGLGFLDNPSSWILPPERVAVSVSADGETWTEPRFSVENTAEPAKRDEGPRTIRHRVSFPTVIETRFVRLDVARGRLPTGHPGAGDAAWLFADEIEIW